MRVTIDPPMDAWPDGGPIATGHQPALWHPGILAKYLAADLASATRRQPILNLVVDQDTLEPLTVELPAQRGDRLSIRRVALAPCDPNVPVGCQPPADAPGILARLDALPDDVAADVSALRGAFEAIAGRAFDTLAQQVAAALDQLLKPWIHAPVRHVFTTGLNARPWFEREVSRLRDEARRCVAAYNEAVSAYPAAGVTRLRVEPDRVEVPLWVLRWNRPRRRVFVDLADSTPLLTTDDGEPLDRDAGDRLAPRALLMMAWVRRHLGCALFIHGTGGGAYDRITDRWWSAWRGEDEPLAPYAVVTADVHLPFDAPVAEPAALRRAVWWRHHLPHNLDRQPGVDGRLVQRKRALLAHMDDDRDRARRRAAFHEIHRINDELARLHADRLHDADRRLRAARAGVGNHHVAHKRDWPFALYPPQAIERLRQQLRDARAELNPLDAPRVQSTHAC